LHDCVIYICAGDIRFHVIIRRIVIKFGGVLVSSFKKRKIVKVVINIVKCKQCDFESKTGNVLDDITMVVQHSIKEHPETEKKLKKMINNDKN